MTDPGRGTSAIMVGEGFFARARAYLDADHRELSQRDLVTFFVTGLVLAAGAIAGIVWLVVGWRPVLHELRNIAWIWLAVAAGATVISHVGYLLAYREVARHDDGPEIHPARAAALVVTGFGLVVPRGGFAIDNAALCEHGI